MMKQPEPEGQQRLVKLKWIKLFCFSILQLLSNMDKNKVYNLFGNPMMSSIHSAVSMISSEVTGFSLL